MRDLTNARAATALRAKETLDAYQAALASCLHCLRPLSYKQAVHGKQKFCSSKCAASHNNMGRKRSIESRLKTAVSVRKALGLPDKAVVEPVVKVKKVPVQGVCEHCAKVFTKKYARQRYCRRDCYITARRTSQAQHLALTAQRVTSWRQQLKQKAVEYKGGCCQRCGYSRCIRALEFHHENPNEKEFSISVKGNTRGWSAVQKELDKCILVCANCHREIHEGLSPL